MASHGLPAHIPDSGLSDGLVVVLFGLLRSEHRQDPEEACDDGPAVSTDQVAQLVALGLVKALEGGDEHLQLTDQGEEIALAVLRSGAIAVCADPTFGLRVVPVYLKGKLSWRGTQVKMLEREAGTQDVVLQAFQDQQWKEEIGDPLPPDNRLDPKERMREVVKRLNKGLTPGTIRFHANGRGTGVRWSVEPERKNSEKNA